MSSKFIYPQIEVMEELALLVENIFTEEHFDFVSAKKLNYYFFKHNDSNQLVSFNSIKENSINLYLTPEAIRSQFSLMTYDKTDLARHGASAITIETNSINGINPEINIYHDKYPKMYYKDNLITIYSMHFENTSMIISNDEAKSAIAALKKLLIAFEILKTEQINLPVVAGGFGVFFNCSKANTWKIDYIEMLKYKPDLPFPLAKSDNAFIKKINKLNLNCNDDELFIGFNYLANIIDIEITKNFPLAFLNNILVYTFDKNRIFQYEIINAVYFEFPKKLRNTIALLLEKRGVMPSKITTDNEKMYSILKNTFLDLNISFELDNTNIYSYVTTNYTALSFLNEHVKIFKEQIAILFKDYQEFLLKTFNEYDTQDQLYEKLLEEGTNSKNYTNLVLKSDDYYQTLFESFINNLSEAFSDKEKDFIRNYFEKFFRYINKNDLLFNNYQVIFDFQLSGLMDVIDAQIDNFDENFLDLMNDELDEDIDYEFEEDLSDFDDFDFYSSNKLIN